MSDNLSKEDVRDIARDVYDSKKPEMVLQIMQTIDNKMVPINDGTIKIQELIKELDKQMNDLRNELTEIGSDLRHLPDDVADAVEVKDIAERLERAKKAIYNVTVELYGQRAMPGPDCEGLVGQLRGIQEEKLLKEQEAKDDKRLIKKEFIKVLVTAIGGGAVALILSKGAALLALL